MAGIVGSNCIVQIAIVVRDLEKAKRKYAEFLGLPISKSGDGGRFEEVQTWYNGAPAPDANLDLVVFKVGPNLYLELMQPNGCPSVWQDHLDQHGEGVHHISLEVDNMAEKIASCERHGYALMQKGEMTNRNGRYAYVDSRRELKVIFELLQFDTPMSKIFADMGSDDHVQTAKHR